MIPLKGVSRGDERIWKRDRETCSRQVFGKYCDNVGDYDRTGGRSQLRSCATRLSRRLNFERCSATDLNLIRTKIPGLVAGLKGACLHEISTLRTPLSPVEAATPGVCTRVETRVIYTRLNVYSHFNIVLYSLSREETISI